MRNNIAFVAAAVVFGCASNNTTQFTPRGNLAGADANALSAANVKFEKAEDPAFTGDTRFAAGQLAESQGNVGQAITQYQEALKIDPHHQQSLYRLGILLTQVKQYPQALDVWRQYVKVNNTSATPLSNLGFCYELAGQASEAEKAYKMGLDREPTNQPCRINYGLMLARLGRRDEAIKQLSVVLKPADVHYNLASVYEQMGEKDQARADYQQALRLNPNLWEAQARLSSMH
jgi:tetratricopeptide (TPR) repeat protein